MAWIYVVVCPGFKANSKKIEGRLLESHPKSYLSTPPSLPLLLPVSPSGLLQQAPYIQKGPIPLSREIKQKPNRAVCAMWGGVVKVISLIGNNEFLRNRVSHSARIPNQNGRCLFIWPRSLFSQHCILMEIPQGAFGPEKRKEIKPRPHP